MQRTVQRNEDVSEQFGFDALRTRYNFQNTSPRRQFFAELVISELSGLPQANRVLDIGCGRGIGRQVKWTWMIRKHVDEFWGVEPDSEIVPEPDLFDHFQHATVEEANLPENAFDLAYSYMVMEHVADPAGFLRAVYRCLKPGGSYIFITPNGSHYFALITRMFNAVKLDDFVLRILKGRSELGYHYPVQYLCNTPRMIDRIAAETKFEQPKYVFVEEEGPSGYLRGPLKLILHAGNLKRRVMRNHRSLLNLVARLTKPETTAD